MNAATAGSQAWQTIKVFVSSTFQDFEDERRALGPLEATLNEELADRAVDVVFVDLRWGIVAEGTSGGRHPQEEREAAVLDRCLAVVDECAPWFVGLLGEREGWVPPAGLLRQVAEDGGVDLGGARSVTQLECRAALGRDEEKGPLLYVFGSEVPSSTAAIVEEAERRAGAEVHHVSAEPGVDRVQAFVDRLRLDLLERVGEHLRATGTGRLDPVDEHFARARARTPVSSWDVRNLLGWVDRHRRQIIAVGVDAETEQAGAVMLAGAAEALRTRPGTQVFLHSTVASPSGRSLRALVRRLVLALGGRHDPEMDLDASIAELRAVVADSADQLFLLVDGMDELYELAGRAPRAWLAGMPRQLTVIFTATRPGQTIQARVGELGEDDVAAHVRERLSRHGKDVPDAAVQALLALEGGRALSFFLPHRDSMAPAREPSEQRVLAHADREWVVAALDALVAPDSPWTATMARLPPDEQATVVVDVVRGLPTGLGGLLELARGRCHDRLGEEATSLALVFLVLAREGVRLPALVSWVNDAAPDGTTVSAADLIYLRSQFGGFVRETADDARWQVVGRGLRDFVERSYRLDQDDGREAHRFLVRHGFPSIAPVDELGIVTWLRLALAVDDHVMAARILSWVDADDPVSGALSRLCAGDASRRGKAGAAWVERLDALVAAAEPGGVAALGAWVLERLRRDLSEDADPESALRLVDRVRRRAREVAETSVDHQRVRAPEAWVAQSASEVLAELLGLGLQADLGTVAPPAPRPPVLAFHAHAARIDRVRAGLAEGDLEAARAALVEARLADDQDRGSTLLAEAMVDPEEVDPARLADRWEELHGWFAQSLDSERSPGWVAHGLVLSAVLRRQGRLRDSRTILEQAFAAARGIGERWPGSREAHVLYQVAHLQQAEWYWAAGDGVRAVEQLDPAEEVFWLAVKDWGRPVSPVLLLLHTCSAIRLAELYLARRDARRAMAAADRARASFDRWRDGGARAPTTVVELGARVEQVVGRSRELFDRQNTLTDDEFRERGDRAEGGVHSQELISRSEGVDRTGNRYLADAHLDRAEWAEAAGDLGRAVESRRKACAEVLRLATDAEAEVDVETMVGLLAGALRYGDDRPEDVPAVAAAALTLERGTELGRPEVAEVARQAMAALEPLGATTTHDPAAVADPFLEQVVWSCAWRPTWVIAWDELVEEAEDLVLAEVRGVDAAGGDEHALAWAAEVAARRGDVEAELECRRALLEAATDDLVADEAIDRRRRLGSVLWDLERWAEAHDLEEEAESLARAAGDDEQVRLAQHNRATALVRLGEHARAAELLREVDAGERAAGEPPMSRASTLGWLGEALLGAGDVEGALDVLREQQEIFEDEGSPDEVERAREGVAHSLGLLGRWDEALVLREESLSWARAEHGQGPLLWRAALLVGEARSTLGDARGALDVLAPVADAMQADGAFRRRHDLDQPGDGLQRPVLELLVEVADAVGDRSASTTARLRLERLLPDEERP